MDDRDPTEPPVVAVQPEADLGTTVRLGPPPRRQPGTLRRDARRKMSLCETLDRVLNKGVVVRGELVLSVAEIDLVYIGVNVLLSSVETLRRTRAATPEASHALG